LAASSDCQIAISSRLVAFFSCRYTDRTTALAIGRRVRVVDSKQDWYGLAPGCKEQERKQVVAVPAGSRDYCSGKKPDDVLFPTMDARKTLAWINAQAKTNVQGHGLFACHICEHC